MISRNCWTVKEKSRDAVVRGKSGSPALVVRKNEDEAGAKAEEAGPLPDSQGLNFSISLYIVAGTIVDRHDFISLVHETSLHGAARYAYTVTCISIPRLCTC